MLTGHRGGARRDFATVFRALVRFAILAAAVLGLGFACLAVRDAANPFSGDCRSPALNGNYSPSWAPDGERLVYVRVTCDPSNEFFLVDRDGGDREKLNLAGVELAVGPAWSPDGRRIAFYGDGGVYVTDVNGNGTRRVFSSEIGGIFDGIAWSPDGRSLAFAVAGSEVLERELVIAPAAGGPARRLGAVGDYELISESRPDWSPDGRWVAVESAGGIDLIRVDGKDRRQLVESGRNAAWSPDGRQLVYSGGAALVFIRPDGTGRRALPQSTQLLADLDGAPYQPAWSPDGRRIAFVAGGDIYTIALDGTDLERIS